MAIVNGDVFEGLKVLQATADDGARLIAEGDASIAEVAEKLARVQADYDREVARVADVRKRNTDATKRLDDAKSRLGVPKADVLSFDEATLAVTSAPKEGLIGQGLVGAVAPAAVAAKAAPAAKRSLLARIFRR